MNTISSFRFTFLFLILASMSTLAAGKDSRCIELRTYYANPDKLDALHARFRNHTLKLFEKHGMVNIGYWVPVDNEENKLVYLLAYPSREAREKSWKSFMADPDWQAVYKASSADGNLVKKADSILMNATDFSDSIHASVAQPNRLFELRTYQAAPGKLDALLKRFREHTVALFKKHGMTQPGYWTPMDEKQGAQDTLIYLLAHRSQEARDKSFADFRADPDWIAAKSASEKDGSLTLKVDSLLLKPTDYSPTK